MSKFVNKKIDRTVFEHHTIGHLNLIKKHEIGGLPKMLINCALLEFGGRTIFAARTTESKDVERKQFFEIMFAEMKTINANYGESKLVEIFYDGWRHGLAHIMIPTKSFKVGDSEGLRKKHMTIEEGQLLISDKQLTSDLIATFKQLLKDNKQPQLNVIVEDHANENVDLNYFTH